MGSYYPCVNPWIALSWPILDGALSALRGMSIEETVAWAEGRAEPQPLPGNRLLTPGQCQPGRTLHRPLAPATQGAQVALRCRESNGVQVVSFTAVHLVG